MKTGDVKIEEIGEGDYLAIIHDSEGNYYELPANSLGVAETRIRAFLDLNEIQQTSRVVLNLSAKR